MSQSLDNHKGISQKGGTCLQHKQRLQKRFLWAAKPYLRDYSCKPTNAKVCLRFSKSDCSSCNL